MMNSSRNTTNSSWVSKSHKYMFKTISAVFKDILTEKDGISFDVTKVQWFVGTIVFFGLSIFSVIKSSTHAFDYTAWGIAFAAILAAGSAGVKIKESTEQTAIQGSVTTSTATTLQEKS
jgi:hypothetical protein